MASNADVLLEEPVQGKRWKRPPQFAKRSKPYAYPTTQRPSIKERLGWPQQGNARPVSATTQAVSDLRDILAQKQKSTITDLRTKIAPKETQQQPARGKMAQTRTKPPPASARQAKAKTAQGKGSQFKPGQGNGGVRAKTGPNKPIMSSTPSVGRSRARATSSSSLEEDAYVQNGEHANGKSARNSSPSHRPSYEDTKKITVTISGLNKPLSEPYPHRREERLAAAITRSREARQQGYMRNRDEYVASAITSAFASDRERERESAAAGMRGRAYSRSPSPISQMNLEPPMARGGPPAPLSRPKSYTTMTTLFISNLSDTVSRNDVAELCQVVGPLEAVYMTAPGVAEVVFKYKDDALEAYRKYNQRNLDGQPMICRLHPTSRGKAASSSAFGSRVPVPEPYSSELYPHHSGYY